MPDAPEEKTLAEIELEDSLRSIRSYRENADAVESTDDAPQAPAPDPTGTRSALDED
jgi:hypothetical protein